MNRIGKVFVSALLSAATPACAVGFRAAAPEPVVSAQVTTAPAPPPPPDPAAPPAPAADVAVTGDAEPVQQGEPEEVAATSEPPELVYEEQADTPGPGYVWIGGYWGWTGADWAWYWGHWAVAPEGVVYIEPYYERVGGRVVYVRGYWGPPNAPRRAYGGDRIVLSRPSRPEGYVRGQHAVIERRPGVAPGHRPGGSYEHAVGSVRPVPTNTAPRRVAVTGEAGVHRSGEEGDRAGSVRSNESKDRTTLPNDSARPGEGRAGEVRSNSNARGAPAAGPVHGAPPAGKAPPKTAPHVTPATPPKKK